ncbi:hypothetical protein [Scatolibacter rhodanostii]|uniref:hypothetical protein n=1 Tax=Scatolibacter rhodanostii TaxID=2014781 RepID=UPI00117DBEF9|nr:hypothetical protein [Scatolibacter rhodanostii]
MNIIDVLTLFKNKIEEMDPISKEYLVSRGNDNGFEKLVPLIADDIKKETSESLEFITHYGHHFPDMDIILNGKRYGLELKSRNNGSWDTNGNSVFESISDEEYEEIYILFGSKEPQKDHILIKFAPYWTATAAINVTHSPRFKINMNADTSVFSSASEYYQLRNLSEKEKVSFLQNYLKENTTGVKWFVPQDTDSIKPTSLNELPSDIKTKIKAEILVLYPQDLITSKRANYSRAHEYIIENYFYYSSSFRDFFSAGGKWKYRNVELPQTLATLSCLKVDIHDILNNANDDFLSLAYTSWSELNIIKGISSFKSDYYKIINYIGELNFSNELKNIGNIQLSELLQL